ncbi:MAG: hypothetical protein K5657_00240 [Desulfovibrio sp.]|nr:hypothetical protein [Desulfovibrio sp.]
MLAPEWLDTLLIAPFRLPASPYAGIWLGSAVLAFWCLIIGELTRAALFFPQFRRFSRMHDDMVRYHNLSVDAIHAGNKDAYLAANTLAHDTFGNAFFAQAATGLASIWPVPFALAWMSQRFEGIALYAIPGTSYTLGYVFVLIIVYIAERILFAKLRPHLPLFSRIEEIKRKEREKRGPMRPF